MGPNLSRLLICTALGLSAVVASCDRDVSSVTGDPDTLDRLMSVLTPGDSPVLPPEDQYGATDMPKMNSIEGSPERIDALPSTGSGGATSSGGTLGWPTGGEPATGGASSGGTGGDSSTGGERTSFGGSGNCTRYVDPTRYNYDSNIPRSTSPPGGLDPEEVPQFVALGWDDVWRPSGIQWSIYILKERNLKNTYFMTTYYLWDGTIRSLWRDAYNAGFEVSNHTRNHSDGYDNDREGWDLEIQNAFTDLAAPEESEFGTAGIAVASDQVRGFRSPYLHYRDELFDLMPSRGLWYDSSIEDGWDPNEGPGAQAWPYTLDNGSAGHDYAQAQSHPYRDFSVGKHAGVFELPAYAMVIPPDSLAEQYGFTAGLKERVRELDTHHGSTSDRIVGLDYDFWMIARLTKQEFVAILKYNLDQRLAGNRAPLLFGMHPHLYVGPGEWREAVEEFLDYAVSLDDVRVVTYREVFNYMREPLPLDCY
ncbi:MAG: polysaccharide deacetylase family protein [Polyangiaceae bacterium]|nr:polysaccharide deacetylase family protein [Polyangiaceae bacterium]